MSSFCIFAAVSVSLFVSFSLCNYLLYLNYYPCLYLYLCIHVSPFFSDLDFPIVFLFRLSLSLSVSFCLYISTTTVSVVCTYVFQSRIAYDKMGYLGSGFPGCLCLRSHRPLQLDGKPHVFSTDKRKTTMSGIEIIRLIKIDNRPPYETV